MKTKKTTIPEKLKTRFLPTVFFVLILLLGAGLRFYHLGEKSLWLDEACSVYRAKQALLPMFKEIIQNDAHPPLHSLLLHFWIRTGESEFWVRNLSSISSILTIFLIYQIGRKKSSEPVGLLAALLWSFSAFATFYAQEARFHSLVTLLVLASTYFFLRAIEENKNKLWYGFIITTVMALYTYLYAFFILLTVNIYLLITGKMKKNWQKFLISELIIIILFSPWLPVLSQRIALAQKTSSNAPYSPFTICSHFINTIFEFSFGYLPVIQPGMIIGTVLIVLLIIIFSCTKKTNRVFIIFLLLCFFLPLIAALLIPLKAHLFEAKHVIFSQPFFCLLIAQGLSNLSRLRICSTRIEKKWSLATILVIFFLLPNAASLHIYYKEDFQKEDWRSAVRFIEENEGEKDLVCFTPPYAGFSFDYYYQGNMPGVGLGEEEKEKLDLLPVRWERIWLVLNYSPVARPSHQVTEWFEKHYQVLTEKLYRGFNGDIRIILYQKNGQ